MSVISRCCILQLNLPPNCWPKVQNLGLSDSIIRNPCYQLVCPNPIIALMKFNIGLFTMHLMNTYYINIYFIINVWWLWSCNKSLICLQKNSIVLKLHVNIYRNLGFVKNCLSLNKNLSWNWLEFSKKG